MKHSNDPGLPEADNSRLTDRADSVASLLRHLSGDVVVPHHGASMTPTLPETCDVTVTCHQNAHIDEGSIVSFAGAGGIVTHRLLYWGKSRRSDGYVITGGDASWLPDAPIQRTELVGVVTKFRRSGEWQTIRQISGNRSTKWTVLRMASLSLLRLSLEIDVRLSLRVFDAIRRFRDRRRCRKREHRGA